MLSNRSVGEVMARRRRPLPDGRGSVLAVSRFGTVGVAGRYQRCRGSVPAKTGRGVRDEDRDE